MCRRLIPEIHVHKLDWDKSYKIYPKDPLGEADSLLTPLSDVILNAISTEGRKQRQNAKAGKRSRMHHQLTSSRDQKQKHDTRCLCCIPHDFCPGMIRIHPVIKVCSDPLR